MYKLAILGSSSGNGHPYSWSSIFNGYDPEFMLKNCPYPAIPAYLKEQSWPESRIQNALVDAIWTQSISNSRVIAKSANIPLVYDSLDSIADTYDYILLARDDSENHFMHCQRAFRRSAYVYIDKPIALSLNALDRLYDLVPSPEHLFSCSALSFCPQLLSFINCLLNPDLASIEFTSPKSWDRYAVHLVDPFISALACLSEVEYSLTPLDFTRRSSGCCCLKVRLELSNRSDPIEVSFSTTGSSAGPIGFQAFSATNHHLILSSTHTDPFSSFKSALLAFVNRFNGSESSDHFTYRHHSQVVKLLSYHN